MSLTEHLDKLNIYHIVNFDTSSLSSIKSGEICRCIIYPSSEGELIYVLKYLKSQGYSYKIIGFCTNTLFCKGSSETIVISTRRMSRVWYNENCILLSSGASINRAQKGLLASGKYISYKMSGIPGSAGGAARQNAGAYGECFSDVFLSCRVYSKSKEKIYTLKNADMCFDYRESVLKDEDLILLDATLALREIDQNELKTLYAEYSNRRKLSQPTEPSLGSFFKRPKNGFASKLIDEAGLRGFRVGDACVSEKQAGFIVNLGSASTYDIISLAKEIKKRVLTRFGVSLEPEVDIVGTEKI